MVQSALSNNMENLISHRDRLCETSIAELFNQDEKRFATYSVQAGRLLLDFSRNHLDKAALQALVGLAEDAGVGAFRDDMFTGAKVNLTEDRAALHTALRSGGNNSAKVAGNGIASAVNNVLDQIGSFSRAIRSGEYKPSGIPVTDVVNIGIGGSDLGPRMALQALASFADGPNVHFVSNVDPVDLADTLSGLDPRSTLFLVVSKTFTTQETMANAIAARSWLTESVGKDAQRHFAAISTSQSAAADFGIPTERTFEIWDWVGGRFSVWSAVGLSLMTAVGVERFREFLAGGHAMDRHFQETPLEKNMPVILALLGIWYRNIWNFPSYAILPYSQKLGRFPAFLQQLEMESNGKCVSRSGDPVVFDTAPVIWGAPGTDGQHAFFQLLHQGTDIIPCDFILAARGSEKGAEAEKQHHLLIANCIAQGAALMVGRAKDNDIPSHKAFEGNRPSNTILMDELDPETLGMLIALYEHKVMVQGCIWDINSFDQFGVELGKELATEVDHLLSGSKSSYDFPGSTKDLVAAIDRMRNS